MTLNEFLSYIIKILIITGVIVFEFNPEYYGKRLARIDIAYDSIWSEYVYDCDCTEPYP